MKPPRARTYIGKVERRETNPSAKAIKELECVLGVKLLDADVQGAERPKK